MFARFGVSHIVRRAGIARVAQPVLASTRQLSTKPQAVSGLKRTLQFLNKHRQSLMNMVAMYFVLSMALHQMRVKKAWDEREEEFDMVKATAEKVESNLTDDAWLDDVARQLNVNRDVLASAIRERIEDAKPKQEEESFDHLTNITGDTKDVKIV